MIQLIRGFKDVLPGEVELWQYIEETARNLFEDFGFSEIRPPILEKTELFARSIGEHTDIVEKEMYTFPDRKGELTTLRPEATATVVRAYIQHKLYAADPIKKFYTIGPMFRRERPQKGRYRQFYQINAEVFGIASALIDAQLILLLKTLCQRLNVSDVTAHINSLGCPDCRPAYKSALGQYLANIEDRLCQDCKKRQYRNPLRVLDCKVPTCREALQGAPSLIDFLGPECIGEFDLLQAALDQMGVPYVIDKNLVRGLDYYTRATFEIQTGSLGAQSAVAGGGRYDGLIKTLGGPDTPATGFAIGLDRLAEIVGIESATFLRRPDLFVAALGEKSQSLAFQWVSSLCLEGIWAEMIYTPKSLKSQMKRAHKLSVPYTLIVGDEELEKGQAVLRNMNSNEQASVSIDGIIEAIKKTIHHPNVG